MKRRGMLGAAAALATFMGGAAMAEPIPEAGIAPAELAELLRQEGFRAQLEGQGTDVQVVSGSEGVTWRVIFYECEGGRCKDIQFYVGLDLREGTTLETINRWNRERRFGRAYLDDDMDPWVELDLDLSPGSSTEQVKDYLQTWGWVLAAFKEWVGFR